MSLRSSERPPVVGADVGLALGKPGAALRSSAYAFCIRSRRLGQVLLDLRGGRRRRADARSPRPPAAGTPPPHRGRGGRAARRGRPATSTPSRRTSESHRAVAARSGRPRPGPGRPSGGPASAPAGRAPRRRSAMTCAAAEPAITRRVSTPGPPGRRLRPPGRRATVGQTPARARRPARRRAPSCRCIAGRRPQGGRQDHEDHHQPAERRPIRIGRPPVRRPRTCRPDP